MLKLLNLFYRFNRSKKMTNLFKKYQNIIFYVIFGLGTTIINVVAYYICYSILNFKNVPSTVIAWVLAVLFAYITNKLFVFGSKSFASDVLIKEILSFVGCRLLTGILDVFIMYIAVDVMSGNPTVWKLISNVIVIILNYIASKRVIFKK